MLICVQTFFSLFGKLIHILWNFPDDFSFWWLKSKERKHIPNPALKVEYKNNNNNNNNNNNKRKKKKKRTHRETPDTYVEIGETPIHVHGWSLIGDNIFNLSSIKIKIKKQK